MVIYCASPFIDAKKNGSAVNIDKSSKLELNVIDVSELPVLGKMTDVLLSFSIADPSGLTIVISEGLVISIS